jgi:hypothetical protein
MSAFARATSAYRSTADVAGGYRSNKLIANIEEQIELAHFALQDRPLKLQKKRGLKVIKVRLRLWWKVDSDENVLTQSRYNKNALNLAGVAPQ